MHANSKKSLQNYETNSVNTLYLYINNLRKISINPKRKIIGSIPLLNVRFASRTIKHVNPNPKRMLVNQHLTTENLTRYQSTPGCSTGYEDHKIKNENL